MTVEITNTSTACSPMAEIEDDREGRELRAKQLLPFQTPASAFPCLPPAARPPTFTKV